MTAPAPPHVYFRAGHIERGSRYEWRDGYSRVTRAGICYPWLTKREAQAEARAHGTRAVFVDTEAAARALLARLDAEGGAR